MPAYTDQCKGTPPHAHLHFCGCFGREIQVVQGSEVHPHRHVPPTEVHRKVIEWLQRYRERKGQEVWVREMIATYTTTTTNVSNHELVRSTITESKI